MTTPTRQEKELREAVKETALKICDLTGFGQPLHPNDIIPDLVELLVSHRSQDLARLKGEVTKVFDERIEGARGLSEAAEIGIENTKSAVLEVIENK